MTNELNIDQLTVTWTFHFELEVGERRPRQIWPHVSIEAAPHVTYEEAEHHAIQDITGQYSEEGLGDIKIKTWNRKVIAPDWIREKMKLWRLGVLGELQDEWGFPKSFIEFHKALSLKSLEELKEAGYIVHNAWMDSDGWGDGFKVTHIVVENNKGYLFKLKWSDTNQGWMKCYPNNCGAGYFDWKEMINKGSSGL